MHALMCPKACLPFTSQCGGFTEWGGFINIDCCHLESILSVWSMIVSTTGCIILPHSVDSSHLEVNSKQAFGCMNACILFLNIETPHANWSLHAVKQSPTVLCSISQYVWWCCTEWNNYNGLVNIHNVSV